MKIIGLNGSSIQATCSFTYRGFTIEISTLGNRNLAMVTSEGKVHRTFKTPSLAIQFADELHTKEKKASRTYAQVYMNGVEGNPLVSIPIPNGWYRKTSREVEPGNRILTPKKHFRAALDIEVGMPVAQYWCVIAKVGAK